MLVRHSSLSLRLRVGLWPIQKNWYNETIFAILLSLSTPKKPRFPRSSLLLCSLSFRFSARVMEFSLFRKIQNRLDVFR